MGGFVFVLFLLYLNIHLVKCLPEPLPIGNLENTFDRLSGTQDAGMGGDFLVKENFASDILSPSRECREGVARALLRHKALGGCYRLPLAFASVDTVCSARCLPATISASQMIGYACSNELDSDDESVLGSWGNGAAARAACKLDASGTRCLARLITASVEVENLRFRARSKSQEYTRVLCNDCLRGLFESVQSPSDVPRLYMYRLLDPAEFFQLGVQYCHWNRSTNH
ncbi:hypothetical protein K493DRAFT_303862 [Basidiobolus meristosporus CBS 931.73]|uniref:Uncharacterized protein n=1 Tax=Basidiobolus meristosporus CBS 931.73 TaxID=1314790 RepID=A0A1Y1Y178_9FUNG|nr:hypothetical protein K493DRAFT_303862 [Basidiobolus meristosporus CBS 931.73]|eukprot:ORX91728.1 hypothetical protein K493DRAFT_303862 [Basidiobolus meristosporus CBS 931.73]